jgi:polygalacturonase
MRSMLKTCLKVMLIVTLLPLCGSAKDIIVTSYGAKGDGKTNNTRAIQKAIDECAKNGGGRVVIPAGEFLTEMISVKSNVDLNITAGATLRAITGGNYTALVMIDQEQNASVTGKGQLFGDGTKYPIKDGSAGRPYLLFVKGSRKVRVSDITLKQGATWTLRILQCDGVTINGVKIYSHANFNNDGIDIDSKNVTVTGCDIDSGDDALCLKSDDKDRLCENIKVSNCTLASNCNFIKMGTSSVSGFRNITIENCTLRKATESPLHHWNDPAGAFVKDKKNHFITDSITGISGIALEVVDGGMIDNVRISNITMTGVQTPIFIRLGSRKESTGSLKNVIISNVRAAARSRIASIISGVPGFNISNVVLRDISLQCMGGSDGQELPAKVPENEKGYPENRMFGWSLPAYGFYIRHADHITLEKVQLTLTEPDSRPAIWLEDVANIKLKQVMAEPPRGGTDWLKQIDATNVTVDK